MDPAFLTTVMTAAAGALSAGATSGLTEVTGSAVKDVYERLKKAISRSAPDDQRATVDSTVMLHEGDPEAFSSAMTTVLSSAGVAEAKDVVSLAQRLAQLVQMPPQSSGTSYTFNGNIDAPHAVFGPVGSQIHVGRS